MDDAWIDLVIPSISQAIIDWCGGENVIKDDNGEVKEQVKMAAMAEIARQERYREGAEKDERNWYASGYMLSMSATAFLTSLRKPTVS